MSGTDSEQSLLTLNLVVNVIIDGLLCVLGYIGNVLTIIVLSKDKAYNSNILLMQVLAGYDIFFLTHTMLYTVLRSVYPTTGAMKAYADISPYIVAFDLPFGWIAQTGTIWFTTALAVDRYIGITRPFKALTICTLKNARIATVVVSIVALLFNFPRFFYYFNVAVHSRNNATFVAHVKIELPGFDADIYRYVYHITLTFIFLYIIPLTALSVLNYKLIKTLQKAGKARKRMSMSRVGSPTKQNLTITFNLVIVISKFILCETPDFISSIVGAIPDASGKTGYKMFNTVKEMLLVFNSAVNFYIYCIFNAKFRQNLHRIMPCCLGRGRHLERRNSASTSTLNVSLSSLTLAISAFKGGRRTRTTSAGQPSTGNDLAPRVRHRKYSSYSESSGKILEEGEEAMGVNRDRLYSAESTDTVLTGVSSDIEVSTITDYPQSVNEDYVVFKPNIGLTYHHLAQRPRLDSTDAHQLDIYHTGEQYGYNAQCVNEDYVIFNHNLHMMCVRSDCSKQDNGSMSNTELSSSTTYTNSTMPYLKGTDNGSLPNKAENGHLYSNNGVFYKIQSENGGFYGMIQSENPDYKVLKLSPSEDYYMSGVPVQGENTHDRGRSHPDRESTTRYNDDTSPYKLSQNNADLAIFTPQVSDTVHNTVPTPGWLEPAEADMCDSPHGNVKAEDGILAPSADTESSNATITIPVTDTNPVHAGVSNRDSETGHGLFPAPQYYEEENVTFV